MPSDKHNSIMAKAAGLISSLFNVASFGHMPFCQQFQCLHHGSTNAYLCTPLFYSFIRYHVDKDLQYMQCETRVNVELAGALLM